MNPNDRDVYHSLDVPQELPFYSLTPLSWAMNFYSWDKDGRWMWILEICKFASESHTGLICEYICLEIGCIGEVCMHYLHVTALCALCWKTFALWQWLSWWPHPLHGSHFHIYQHNPVKCVPSDLCFSLKWNIEPIVQQVNRELAWVEKLALWPRCFLP